MLHRESSDRSKTKLQRLKHVDEFLAVDQLNRRCAVAGCLTLRLLGERASRDDDAFVCAPRHSTTKVAHLRGRNRLGIALTLKQHLERHKRIDLENPESVDSAIATLTSDDNLGEARLPQNSLGKPLEAGRWKGQHAFEDFVAIVL